MWGTPFSDPFLRRRYPWGTQESVVDGCKHEVIDDGGCCQEPVRRVPMGEAEAKRDQGDLGVERGLLDRPAFKGRPNPRLVVRWDCDPAPFHQYPRLPDRDGRKPAVLLGSLDPGSENRGESGRSGEVPPPDVGVEQKARSKFAPPGRKSTARPAA